MTDQQTESVRDPVRVLIVEDSPEYATIIEAALRRASYECETVNTGEAALEVYTEFDPDVILLDVILPGIDGVEVCRRIRAASDVYVVMLTARSQEIDKLMGLAVGADDYLTKPFSPRELVARIAALLRRPRHVASAEDLRHFDRLAINPRTREVFWDGEEIPLTRIEFGLLDQVSSEPHRVHERRELLDAVWGRDWVGDDHVVDVHIANLRKKLDRCGVRHLKTVRGVGYRMAVEPTG